MTNLTKLLTSNSVAFLSGVISTLILASFYNNQAITFYAKVTSASAIFISFNSLKFEKNIVGEKDLYSKKLAKWISLTLPILIFLILLIVLLGNQILGLFKISSGDIALFYYAAIISIASKILETYRNELLSQKRYTTLAKIQIFGSIFNNILQLTLTHLGSAGLVFARFFSIITQLVFKKRQLSPTKVTYINLFNYLKTNLKRQLFFSLGSILTTLIGQSLIIYAMFYPNALSVASVFLAQRFVSVPVAIFTKSSSLINFQELSEMSQLERASLIQKRIKHAVAIAFFILSFFYILSYASVFLNLRNIDSSVIENFRWLLIASFFQVVFAPFGTVLWIPRNNTSHLKVSLARFAILLTFILISHVFLTEHLLFFYVIGFSVGYLFQHSVVLKLLNEK